MGAGSGVGRLLRHQRRDLVDHRVVDAERHRSLASGWLGVEAQVHQVVDTQRRSDFLRHQHFVGAKGRRRDDTALLFEKIEHKAAEFETFVVAIAHGCVFIRC